MHLQAAVNDYDVFARSLSIGPETMVMHFDASRPMHDRYQVDHNFLFPGGRDEVVTIGRTVNAFFRWEFIAARRSSAATTSSRSTTPTPARTWRSPPCTTTSPGR